MSAPFQVYYFAPLLLRWVTDPVQRGILSLNQWVIRVATSKMRSAVISPATLLAKSISSSIYGLVGGETCIKQTPPICCLFGGESHFQLARGLTGTVGVRLTRRRVAPASTVGATPYEGPALGLPGDAGYPLLHSPNDKSDRIC